MNTSKIIRKQAQAGFTLIELIVVIVILGILAATALPRMFDMSGQARLAKMQAALGAVRAASASAHAQWLVNGGQLACAACAPVQPGTAIAAEGINVVLIGGYPDVGGDGVTNAATALGTTSGILVASGLTTPDYVLSTLSTAATPVATNNTFTVSADAAHPMCRFTYTEATQTGGSPTVQPTVVAPVFVATDLTVANCG